MFKTRSQASRPGSFPEAHPQEVPEAILEGSLYVAFSLQIVEVFRAPEDARKDARKRSRESESKQSLNRRISYQPHMTEEKQSPNANPRSFPKDIHRPCSIPAFFYLHSKTHPSKYKIKNTKRDNHVRRDVRRFVHHRHEGQFFI